jgi:hypothetical protein
MTGLTLDLRHTVEESEEEEQRTVNWATTGDAGGDRMDMGDEEHERFSLYMSLR